MTTRRNISGFQKDRWTLDGGGWTLRLDAVQPDTLPRSIRDILGYYADEHGYGATMNPCVIRLPHGRFLSGWTMGEGMCATFESDVIDDEDDAWRTAHHIAERDAEAERDYQARLCTECYDGQRREVDDSRCELPELCDACYMDAPSRTLAFEATR